MKYHFDFLSAVAFTIQQYFPIKAENVLSLTLAKRNFRVFVPFFCCSALAHFSPAQSRYCHIFSDHKVTRPSTECTHSQALSPHARKRTNSQSIWLYEWNVYCGKLASVGGLSTPRNDTLVRTRLVRLLNTTCSEWRQIEALKCRRRRLFFCRSSSSTAVSAIGRQDTIMESHTRRFGA